jgi:hypothetical protein
VKRVCTTCSQIRERERERERDEEGKTVPCMRKHKVRAC